MAYTFRGKRYAYDNIAAGSATGMERHNSGSSVFPGEQTTKENIDNFVTSDVGTNSSFIANKPHEIELGGIVSDMNIWGPGGVDIAPSSAVTPGWTSGTSFTSVFPERLG